MDSLTASGRRSPARLSHGTHASIGIDLVATSIEVALVGALGAAELVSAGSGGGAAGAESWI